jgi:hypothetical protein
VVSATSSISLVTDILGVLGISNGGTGTSTAPGLGQFLIGNGAGGYNYTSTSTLTVATATFASSTAIGASVQNATSTGIFFYYNGQLQQDTGNFAYDPVSKKLTVTGGIDPLFLQIKDVTTATGSGAYFEAYAGNNAATSTAGNGRIRYNASTTAFETSVNGGAWIAIGAAGGGSTIASGTVTNSTLRWNGVAWSENPTFSTDGLGNATTANLIATGTITASNFFATNATVTNSTSTNLFSTFLTAVTSVFTNLFASNATLTNATSSNSFASNIVATIANLSNATLGTTTINGPVSGASILTDGTLSTASNTNIASARAVKTYVDNKVNGLAWRPAADVVSTTTDPASTIVGQVSASVDGHTLLNGDRVLFTNVSVGTATYQNKVFLVGGVGSAITLTLETDGLSGDGKSYC